MAKKIVDIKDTTLQEDMTFLVNLLPSWCIIVPEGLNPMGYGTGSYDKDLAIKKKVEALCKKHKAEYKNPALRRRKPRAKKKPVTTKK